MPCFEESIKLPALVNWRTSAKLVIYNVCAATDDYPRNGSVTG